MDKRNLVIATIRILASLLILSAVTAQLMNSLEFNRSITNFFSFFTVESNILAAIVLLFVGIYQLFGKSGKQIAFFRGAITLFMTMTGVIYVLLLSGNEVSLQTTIPWVNLILHYIMPVYVLADWLLFPPKHYIASQKALVWLLFPAAYMIYSLIRGAVTDWYPYPFIDPVLNGWPQVVVASIVIGTGTAILAWLLALRTSDNKKLAAM
jgi:hypothetical protein